MSSIKTLEYGNDNLLIFCNGVNTSNAIETQKANLLEQVETISSAFGNHKKTGVKSFHNITNLDEYLCQSQTHEERVIKEEKIAGQFAAFISKQVEHLDKTKTRIYILAHSHGALITKKALELLKPNERNQLNVYTFGGVAMIPKNLGNVVENYVYKEDLIARNGNKRYGSSEVLEKVIKITERSLADKTSYENAFLTKFFEKWYNELDCSSHTSKNEESIKNEELLFSNFWSKDPEMIKGFEERFQKYSFLNDYNITILTKPLEKNDEIFKDKFEDLVASMKKKMASFGEDIDNHYHKITAFKHIISEIAKKNGAVEESAPTSKPIGGSNTIKTSKLTCDFDNNTSPIYREGDTYYSFLPGKLFQ